MSIRCDRHALQLQKELHERRAPATDRSKSIYRSIEFKIRLLTLVKGRPGLTPQFVAESQHAKDLLNGIDLVARNNPIYLAERAHDGESRFNQRRLRNTQPANHRSSQCSAGEIADNSTHKQPDRATCEQADDCADQCKCHY